MSDYSPSGSPLRGLAAEGTKVAPSLFNRPDADVILSSSDGTPFRVYRQILCIASPFFEDMFKLPQPQSPTDSPGSPPVITVEEDAHSLEDLLRIIYPVRDPQLTINVLTDWQHISNMCHAAIKYDIVQAVDFMKAKLAAGVDAFPLEVFCIACKHRLESVAKSAAARLVVDEPNELFNYVPLLEDIPAGCLHRLLRLQDDPAKDLEFCSQKTEGESSVAGGDTSHHRIRDPRDLDPDRRAIQAADRVYYDVSEGSFQMFESSQAPSSIDSEPTADDEDDTSATHSAQNSSLLTLPEDSQTIDLILRAEAQDTSDLEHIALGLRAAAKYKAGRARRSLAKHWSWRAEEDPLLSYLIAATHGLETEAVASARRLLSWNTERLRRAYTPVMECISAGHYYRLLHYREACMKVTSGSMLDLWTASFPPTIRRICYSTIRGGGCRENGQSRWADKCFRHIQSLQRPYHGSITEDSMLVGELCFLAASCDSCRTHISSTDIATVVSAYAIANEECIQKVCRLYGYPG